MYRCVFCERPSEGNYTIHERGMGVGQDGVPLCDACGGHEKPTCEEIWARIADKKRRGIKIEHVRS